jgi:hypothetical protein
MVNLSQQKRLAASVAGVGQRKSKSDLNWMYDSRGKRGKRECWSVTYNMDGTRYFGEKDGCWEDDTY